MVPMIQVKGDIQTQPSPTINIFSIHLKNFRTKIQKDFKSEIGCVWRSALTQGSAGRDVPERDGPRPRRPGGRQRTRTSRTRTRTGTRTSEDDKLKILIGRPRTRTSRTRTRTGTRTSEDDNLKKKLGRGRPGRELGRGRGRPRTAILKNVSVYQIKLKLRSHLKPHPI